MTSVQFCLRLAVQSPPARRPAATTVSRSASTYLTTLATSGGGRGGYFWDMKNDARFILYEKAVLAV